MPCGMTWCILLVPHPAEIVFSFPNGWLSHLAWLWRGNGGFMQSIRVMNISVRQKILLVFAMAASMVGCSSEGLDATNGPPSSSSMTTPTCWEQNTSCEKTGIMMGIDVGDWCDEDAKRGQHGLSECVLHKEYFKRMCGTGLCSGSGLPETQCFMSCRQVYRDNTAQECIDAICRWNWLICENNKSICK